MRKKAGSGVTSNGMKRIPDRFEDFFICYLKD
jgi:hypothetical protein